MLNKIKTFFQENWESVFFVLFLLLWCIGIIWRFQTLNETIKEKQQTIDVMTEKHSNDINALQNELDINKQNAEVLHDKIIDAQYGLRQPDAGYKVPKMNGETLTTTIEKQLAQKDSTVPPEAYEKTDRTVVVEQPDNKDVPVAIYKINTYRNWELGTGVGYQDGSTYVPVSIQRNYDKQHSVMLEAHFDVEKQKVNGGEAQWKIHF